ncbi:glycosyltransferase family 39 protein [Maricaulis sp.]|uniref:ArnT family glycosyltransferase n=1 Tax=Maricaulis sp. TaxID=1486257 RepID=UPI0026287D6F|nr:glycosyltransferase family 39 protein [Maricaulis sp.]
MAELARGWRAYFIVGLIAALAALAGVFTLPPLDRDESRYAQATAQMLESGDFVRINYLDDERNKKPVGIHWMQAVSVAALSSAEARDIWAYRLPSVLGAILATLACFWGGQRLLGREAAFAGSALFAASVMLGIEGGIAKTDAVLVGATTLAMAALANLRTGAAGWRSALVFWFALGLGVLIKGPVTPMVAGLTAAVLIVWERRIAWLKPLLVFWPGPVLAIAMVVPWLVTIQIATDGNFLREALGDDLGPKLVSADERHGGWPGYHLLLLPLTFFPAVLFLVPGVGRLADALRSGSQRAEAARFLVAWAVPTWIVFEFLPTKLPHYVLPAFPALALVAGWGLVELGKAALWQRWTGRALFAGGGLVFAVALPVIYARYGTGLEQGPGLGTSIWVFSGLAIFVALAAASLTSERLRPGPTALILAVLAGLGWHLAARGAALPNAEAVRLADRVRAVRDSAQSLTGVPPDAIVTASSYTEPSLVFSLGSDTVLGTTGEVLAFAESREDPTLVVLDLWRDDALRQAMAATGDEGAPRRWTLDRNGLPCPSGSTAIAGTNYSRGTDTVLAVFFTPCPEMDDHNDPQDRNR